ncbi:MAG TPA: Nif3-like dinuclear metal center hexameric protein [Pirellulales bacterium]|nr:Nif3-like dinuclear metal center hexameric protein [Pirellulales bacterium]
MPTSHGPTHTVADLSRFFDHFAPSELAESWDNVGLLVGDPAQAVQRVMTCLTITPATAREAIAGGANLIVTHHPLPFRPLQRLTVQSSEGRLLWELIGSRVSVYCPHTAFDSAAEGINQRLAAGLELEAIAPLAEGNVPGLGAGRFGRLASPLRLADLAERVKRLLAIDHAQAVGPLENMVQTVAVACGSASEFLPVAAAAGCHAIVTGELRFHSCLEAEFLGLGVVLAGHYASERFALDELAITLGQKFPELQVWASQQERDPVHWL